MYLVVWRNAGNELDNITVLMNAAPDIRVKLLPLMIRSEYCDRVDAILTS